ncbi:MAG: molybdopterin-dependent oxidoreductase [Desulfobacterales bacterium]|nr:molybdopterin-dependent oxidoreductase [Desulfobacterales bacterium]
MDNRRIFLKKSMGVFFWLTGLFSPVVFLFKKAYAEAKRVILPKGTPVDSLSDKNPELLDTRNLDVTPLKKFKTMGQIKDDGDSDSWQLQVDGYVANPLRFSYRRLLKMPVVERDVLLICPGFFANHGRWRGLSINTLLEKAKVLDGATHVHIRGPDSTQEQARVFPISEVLSDKIFLAYGVNGEKLPEKHGYPLRVVAEDYYGDTWIKYVYKLTVLKRDES